MFVSHEYVTPKDIQSNLQFMSPPVTQQDQTHVICYINKQNQLTIQQQFKDSVVHSPTRHEISCATLITVKGQPLIALGTLDISHDAHILIYDFNSKRLINQCDFSGVISNIVQAGDGVILVSSDDSVYCYQLTLSHSGFMELFWSVSSKITHILPITMNLEPVKIKYAVVSQDLYLRVFENEQLLAETKLFTRTTVSSVSFMCGYFGALSANNKFRLVFFNQKNKELKLIMNAENDSDSFEFVFKPFAKNLNGKGEDVETQIHCEGPLPFIITKKGDKISINVANLEEGKLCLKKLLDMPAVGGIQRFIAEQELFELFVNQYIEGKELGNTELPFISEQVKNQCRQFIINNNEKVTIFEFPIIFDFQMILDAISEMEGSVLEQYGFKPSAKNAKAKEDEEDEEEPADGTNAQKTKKKSKIVKKKKAKLQESTDYQEIVQLQSKLFNLKMQKFNQQTLLKDVSASDLQLQFSAKNRLESEKGPISAYTVNFEGKTQLFNLEPVQQVPKASSLDFSSDILNSALKSKSQLSSQEFNNLSFVQKHLFIQTPQNADLPPTTTQSVNTVQLIMNQNCYQVDMKTCVLPSFQLSGFGTSPQTPEESVVSFQGVSLQQFKVAFQLQTITCQLQADFNNYVIKTSLSTLKNINESKPDIYVKFTPETQTLQIRGQNLRAILSYALVFSKAAKLDAPAVFVGEYAQWQFTTQFNTLKQLKNLVLDTHRNLQDLSQAQIYTVSEITNKLVQKQFGNIFGQFEGVVQKGFNDVSVLYKTQVQIQDIKNNLEELADIYSGMNKEAAGKLREGINKGSWEGIWV
ncbi:Conserved_hypothetical protein [Hexamita inflata]|uniref:Uncharacterized protein n=1 Tax=Hexamita inflata TaxID=28002 RepID=A0ABP1GG74_9EUKA